MLGRVLLGVSWILVLVATGFQIRLERLRREMKAQLAAKKVWTCAEMLGPHPRPGYIAVLPPGYKAIAGFAVNPETGEITREPDFRIWNEKGELVCNRDGTPVELR